MPNTKTTEKARGGIEKRECWQSGDIGWLSQRKDWMVESYHWHLDVTFREDDNRTLEKQAAFNQNILGKLALNILKMFNTGKKKLSVGIEIYK